MHYGVHLIHLHDTNMMVSQLQLSLGLETVGLGLGLVAMGLGLECVGLGLGLEALSLESKSRQNSVDLSTRGKAITQPCA